MVSLYESGNLVHKWKSKTESGGPFEETVGMFLILVKVLTKITIWDPMWLRFDRTSHPVEFDQLNISFAETGQIASLEVALAGDA